MFLFCVNYGTAEGGGVHQLNCYGQIGRNMGMGTLCTAKKPPTYGNGDTLHSHKSPLYMGMGTRSLVTSQSPICGTYSGVTVYSTYAIKIPPSEDHGRKQVNKALHTCTSWYAYAAMFGSSIDTMVPQAL